MSDEEKTRDQLIAELQSLRRQAAQYEVRGQNCPQACSSEERYRALFEDAPVSLWEEDFSETKALLEQFRRQGVSDFHAYFTQHPEVMETCMRNVKVLWVNRATSDLFGASDLSELLERLPQTFTEDGLITFQHALTSLAEGRPLFEEETTMRTLQGDLRHVLMRSFASPDDFTFSHVVVAMVDITKQKQAAAQLSYQSALLQQVSDAIIATDLRLTITSWNTAAVKIYGWGETEAMGQKIDELLKTEFLTDTQAQAQTLLAATGIWQGNIRQRSKEGKVLEIEASVSLARNRKGEIIGGVTVNRDVTARKQAEAVLKESETNFRTFFNTVPDFLFILDEQGMIQECNQAVLDRLGYAPEALLRRPVWNVHPENRRQEAAQIITAMFQGAQDSCLLPLITCAGELIPVETSISKGVWNGKPALFGVSKDISALTFSEEKFSKAFYLNPSACGISDVENDRYIEVNDAFFQAFGFEKQEVLGKTAYELGILTPAAGQGILQKAGERGRISNVEAALNTKSGKVLHVLLSAENLYLQNKKYRYTIVQDITERKQAEAALRASKERLILALNVARMGYWRIDCATNKVEWSNGHERLFGISLDEFGGTLDDVQQCVHPDDRDMGIRNLQRALEGNGDFINTYRVIYPNGDIHWLYSHGYVYRDGQGRPDYIFGITQDITARKQIEEQLRESEERFRLIAENTSDGILVFEQERIVYTSPAYNRMMEVPEHSADGLGPAEIAALIHPEDCERIFTNIYAAIAQKRDDLRYAYRTTTGTGRLIWREDHARFIYDQEGRHQKSYVVCRDITERIRVQEEARQREQQIQRANKLASLGVLVSGIAHEINNPNNFISLNVSTLRKYLADLLPVIDAYVQERQPEEFAGLPYPEFRKELFELVEDIDYGSQRINAIVSNFREYSYQKAERQWQWIEIPCVIEKAYLLCQGKIRKTVASFKTQFPDPLEPVYTDPDALEQIVVNLLINAAQAMDKPDSHILVCVAASALAPEHVQIEIRDNGCGIEQARLDKIFEPFYTTKPLGEGIGLGLYICHNLLAGIGGKLEIESQPGVGSTFRILLTRAAKEVAP